MGRFLDLPNEILSQVALELFPEDLVNFALVNRHCLNNADQALRQHKELLGMYAVFDGCGSLTLPMMIMKVLVDPRIGHYVRELSVGTLRSNERMEYSEEDLQLLERTLLESCLLPEIQFYYGKTYSEDGQLDEKSTSDTPQVYRELKYGDQFLPLALLLLHLPNITAFSWLVECPEGYELEGFILLLRRLSLQDPSTVCSKLRRVTLSPYEDTDELDCDLLKVFMAFPSVHSVEVWRLTFVERVKEYEPLPWPQTSNLTHLTLDEPEVDWTKSIPEMMASCANLKVFKYSLMIGVYDFRFGNDIFGVVLQQATLLEELTMSFHGVDDLPDSVFRLRNLTKLRYLETECWILRQLYMCDLEDSHAGPARNLPPSLQHLSLSEQLNGDQTQDLEIIIKLLHRCEKYLPELRKLDLFLLEQDDSNDLGYLTRLISFIGQEKGVEVCVTILDHPRTILQD